VAGGFGVFLSMVTIERLSIRSKPMLYHVTRNEQSYGPYTLEDLQRYVASGNVLPTDLAKGEEMTEWVPVAQVLGGSVPAAGPGMVTPYASGAAPAYPAGVAQYPDPPNLHWGLVLLIGVFTCGLFIVIWDFVEAAWMRKLNPRSNAIFFYIAAVVFDFVLVPIRIYLMIQSGMQLRYNGLGFATFVLVFTFIQLARFDMRRYMLEHFNGPEPVGLSLNAVMTFFFGGLYFQYHFTRINEMKRMARYGGSAI
jgi:GYF domain 2